MGYLLHKVGEFNGPPVPCLQDNAQMLTNRPKMQLSTHTSLHSFGALRRSRAAAKTFSDGATDLSYFASEPSLLSERGIITQVAAQSEQHEPARIDSGERFIIAFFP